MENDIGQTTPAPKEFKLFNTTDTLVDDIIRNLARDGIVLSEEIKSAFLDVDRAKFDPTDNPYIYTTLSIDLPERRATISSPIVVAEMMEYLDIKEGERVLEVGSGSGYAAAVAAKLVGDQGRIFGVEVSEKLVKLSRSSLRNTGVENVEIFQGDGLIGLPEHAPFDKIFVSACVNGLPDNLVDQLAQNGVLVAPFILDNPRNQRFVRLTNKDGVLISEPLSEVTFIPAISDQPGGFSEDSDFASLYE